MQEGDPECIGHPKLYSHVFLDKLFDELGLEDFFRSYKGFSKIQYDVLNFTRLLVYGRILNPDSKIATLEQNNDYYTPLLKNFNKYNVYDQNHGYIIAKSLLRSTKSEQEWAYSDDGFIEVSKDFKYKSHIIKRTVKDSNGKKITVTENVIVYWSRNFYERDLHENARFLETLEKILKNPKGFRVTDMQARLLRPFFRGDILNAETGEVIASSKLRALLDKEKLEEFKSHFGFYQIVTSEINMPPLEAIEKYHGLTRIEDQFRVMKSDLETRPIYVRKREHIEAHLLICLISLTMIRMIQCKICKSGIQSKSDDATLWSMGLPAYRVQKALNKWKVDLLADDLYRFTDLDNPDLKLILDSFNIKIPTKLFRKIDLKSQINNINMGI